MNAPNENALEFIKSELKKAQLEFSKNKSGREGVDFILKTNIGNQHEIYLQPINLSKERSVNLPAGRNFKTRIGRTKRQPLGCFDVNS